MKQISSEDLAKVIADVLKEKVGPDLGQRGSPFDLMQGSLLKVPVGVSNRHLHITKEHFQKLYGTGTQLTKLRDISQKGQFAAHETVTLETPEGKLSNLRIIGPFRSQTQIELARTDAYRLRIDPPVKESGHLEGSTGGTLVGPKGRVELKVGIIIAARHIHFSPMDAKRFAVSNGDRVSIYMIGERGVMFTNVIARVRDDFVLDFHLDTDEANAANLRTGDFGYLIPKQSMAQLANASMNGKRKVLTERMVSEMVGRGETIDDEQRFIITPAARDLAVMLGLLRRR